MALLCLGTWDYKVSVVGTRVQSRPQFTAPIPFEEPTHFDVMRLVIQWKVQTGSSKIM